MTTQVNRAMAMLLAAACKPLMPELQIPNASTPETATDAAMLIVTYQGKTFNVFVEALLSGEDEQLAGEIDQVSETIDAADQAVRAAVQADEVKVDFDSSMEPEPGVDPDAGDEEEEGGSDDAGKTN